MADNMDVSPGSGKTIRADEIGGVLYQIVKPAFGVDGSATLVSTSDPLPVSDAGGSITVDGPLTDTQLRASSVPVTTTPASVTITDVTGTAASSGDNTIIAAPGSGQRLRLHKVQIQLEAATATTVLIKSGSTTFDRLYCAAAGDGKIDVYPVGREKALGTNEALVFNLSGANSCGYTVRYSTEAV